MNTARTYSVKFFHVASQNVETLQTFVRRVRKEKALSTTQVEKNSGGGISSSYITRIENEPFKKVSPEKLIALAKGLGVSEKELFAIATGRELDASSATSSKFELLSLKFSGLKPANRQRAEVLIEILDRELDRMANEPD